MSRPRKDGRARGERGFPPAATAGRRDADTANANTANANAASPDTTNPDAGNLDAAPPDAVNTGAGRMLIAVYALFALAATGRSVMQILEYFHRAPLAYLLSALAAVIYIVATVALARGSSSSVRLARATITTELVGVLAVGAWSLVQPSAFPDKTVWSHFGQGYGFVPLLLPIVGLWWLRRDHGKAVQ